MMIGLQLHRTQLCLIFRMPSATTQLLCCYPQGELPGDLVTQLQKVAFEVYRTEYEKLSDPYARSGGNWMSCDQDVIVEKRVHKERYFSVIPGSHRSGSRPSSVPSTPNQRFGVLPMTPHTSSVNLPSTPSSPVSNSSSLDYFGAHSRKTSSSSIVSPSSGEISLPSTDGGPVRRQRAGSSNRGPIGRPVHKKRQSADGYMLNSFEPIHNSCSAHIDSPQSCWSLDVGDVCVWSIVSTEQITYTFYVPSLIVDMAEPVTPLPVANRLLLSNEAKEMGPAHNSIQSALISQTNAPFITMCVA